ncbi:hypothetical protein BTO32_17520 [Marinobacter lutaoensis]|uniref:Uncharacterized protein n=1 Tax=Marinobacter lutaoensis TaxID=135739 RepID=A0A1V2DNE6_9GAMM|nr:hypothetical protein BTO32_17520 [Marinobacter lutaoensis]
MGYVGFEAVAGDKAGAERDKFIEEALRVNKFSIVNQSKWLFSHSGMKIPSQEVFEKSFSDAIMRRIVEEGTGFGRY